MIKAIRSAEGIYSADHEIIYIMEPKSTSHLSQKPITVT